MGDGTKVCTKCGIDKSFAEFGRDTHRLDGMHSRCKVCRRADNVRHRAAHPGKSAAYWASNREAQRARTAAWYTANKERRAAAAQTWREANRTRVRALDRARAAAQPGKILAKSARRRGATVVEEFSIDELVEHLRGNGIDPDLCGYCHDAPREEWDHILAIALGGAHTLTNMAPACRRCNGRKATVERVESIQRRQAS